MHGEDLLYWLEASADHTVISPVGFRGLALVGKKFTTFTRATTFVISSLSSGLPNPPARGFP